MQNTIYTLDEDALLDAWVEKIDNWPYQKDFPTELMEQAKAEGIVIVFGASDDLVEVRGLIDQEYDAYNGFDGEILGYRVTARYGDPLPFWVLEVNKNHRVFSIWEDKEELSCLGVVFHV